jgi:hypothetical protein
MGIEENVWSELLPTNHPPSGAFRTNGNKYYGLALTDAF